MSEPPSLETLARRYLDLWQDQVSALATDPEFTETVGRLLQVSAALGPAGWMSLWAAASAGLQPQQREAPRDQPATAPSPQTAGPTPAAAASAPGSDDLAELRRRLAILEERLAHSDGGRDAERDKRVEVAREPTVASDGPRPGHRTAPRARRRRS